jgi:hypothetical protein
MNAVINRPRIERVSVRSNHGDATDAACSLSQPKSDISDFGHLLVTNSGKPEFVWERGGVRGFGLSVIYPQPATPAPPPSPHRGEGVPPSLLRCCAAISSKRALMAAVVRLLAEERTQRSPGEAT